MPISRSACLALAAALSLSVAACGNTRDQRTATGAVLGGAGGAVVGNAVGGTGGAIVGGVGGAVAGGVIGSNSQ
ncbi:glycine zipper 2TM domain-containing protein [Chthonobacter albigriseus]|uniref:glycine zipper 2TM domain-containing protein n=1 Tax=Chthonobacter albigriseus TaxID=1683161 RepID=UPI0015EE7F9C|nr:glycine zipper 2TM domain-containing protein [Chthonobacter albigriseus]